MMTEPIKPLVHSEQEPHEEQNEWALGERLLLTSTMSVCVMILAQLPLGEPCYDFYPVQDISIKSILI